LFHLGLYTWERRSRKSPIRPALRSILGHASEADLVLQDGRVYSSSGFDSTPRLEIEVDAPNQLYADTLWDLPVPQGKTQRQQILVRHFTAMPCVKHWRKGRRIGLHAFRHALASLLVQSTGAAVAQRQLRHANARTTLEIYAHVLRDDHQEAMEQIESVLLRPSGT
jgi:hypothetical protein